VRPTRREAGPVARELLASRCIKPPETRQSSASSTLKFRPEMPIAELSTAITLTQMSKTLAKNNSAIVALVRDAYGNGLSGNTERSLRFIREALKLLEAQHEVIETKGDARKQLAFDALNREAAQQSGWPEFDGSQVQENIEKWAKKGLTLDLLPGVPAEEAAA
jgi:hypothetical protein